MTVRLADLDEPQAAVEVRGHVLVKSAKYDGDLTLPGGLDRVGDDGGADASPLERRGNHEFSYMHVARALFDADVTAWHARARNELKLAAKPVIREEVVLLRFIPSTELPLYDRPIGGVMRLPRPLQIRQDRRALTEFVIRLHSGQASEVARLRPGLAPLRSAVATAKRGRSL